MLFPVIVIAVDSISLGDIRPDLVFNENPVMSGFANLETVFGRRNPFGFGIRVEAVSKRGIFVCFCS